MENQVGVLRLQELFCRTYEGNNHKPLSHFQARRIIQGNGAKTSYTPGTTIDNILDSLAESSLIVKFRPVGSKGEMIIPLEYSGLK